MRHYYSLQMQQRTVQILHRGRNRLASDSSAIFSLHNQDYYNISWERSDPAYICATELAVRTFISRGIKIKCSFGPKLDLETNSFSLITLIHLSYQSYLH